jgi:hypothetical protein
MKRVVLTALLLVLVLEARSATSQGVTPAARATCVFSNPAFAGKCVESANIGKGSSPKQACQSILACLNDTGCLKTYCQATTLRSGWRLESAKGPGQGQ